MFIKETSKMENGRKQTFYYLKQTPKLEICLGNMWHSMRILSLSSISSLHRLRGLYTCMTSLKFNPRHQKSLPLRSVPKSNLLI